MEKEVFVLLAGYPFGTNRFSERLRMALGLTLNDDNKVSILFTGDARNGLGKLDEAAAGINPIHKNIDMLSEMGASIYMEDGDGFADPDNMEVTRFKAEELDDLLEKADVIIT